MAAVESVEQYLHRVMQERIIVLDGAMGTMVQKYKLTEADFRGTRQIISESQFGNDFLSLKFKHSLCV